MKKNPRKVRSWLITLPLIAVTAAYLFLFQLPLRRQLSSDRAEIERMEQSIAELGELTREITEVEADNRAADDYAELWEARLTPADNVYQVYGEISDVIAASGASTTSFDPDEPQEFPALMRIPIRMSCSGGFPQVWRLLCELDDLPYLLWVNELSLRGAGERGEVMTCSADLAIFASSSGNSDEVNGSANR